MVRISACGLACSLGSGGSVGACARTSAVTGGFNLLSRRVKLLNNHHSPSCDSTKTSTKAIPNCVMACVSASVVSCATVGFLSGSIELFTGSSMRQGFLQMRIPQRHQRPLFQLKQEHSQPQAADTDRCCEIHPMRSKAGLMKTRRHLPEKVAGAH